MCQSVILFIYAFVSFVFFFWKLQLDFLTTTIYTCFVQELHNCHHNVCSWFKTDFNNNDNNDHNINNNNNDNNPKTGRVPSARGARATAG